jgi:pimeloyl-ACP methyl ester carboxylesterase
MPETILMIHGMCGGAWVWDHYCATFESLGYRCTAATLRHHDVDPQVKPPPQLGTTGLLDYVRDLTAEVERLEVEPILMGHSIGGLLAQMLGSRMPCKALVLLAPVPPAGILCLKPSIVKGFGSILTRWGWWKAPIRCTFPEAVYGMLHLLPVQDQHRTHDRFAHESGRAAFQSGFWFLDPKRTTTVDASQITCPVLVLAGTQDRLAPAPAMRRVAQRYAPHATYHAFPNHAHWMVAEPGWEEVTDYISGWLDRVLAKE